MILAIDPASSSCGFALFYPDGELFDLGHVRSKGLGVSARYSISTQILQLVARFSPSVMVCEEPKLGGRFQTTSQTGMDKLLGQLEYMMLSNFTTLGGIYYYHPMTIKSTVGGSGKASKLDVALGCGEFLTSEVAQELLSSAIKIEDFDATDAVATGLTYILKEVKHENNI